MKRLNWWKAASAVGVSWLAAAIAAPAQTFTTLANFVGSNGAESEAPLVQGTDGNLYGTTLAGGAYGLGSVFRMARGGVLTTLYSFCGQVNCLDGQQPAAGLVLGTDGNYYGTTLFGGTGDCSSFGWIGCGTVFKITSEGTLTTLHSFNVTDGAGCYPGLIQARDGNFYGATEYGGNGSGCGGFGCGTFFRVTPAGTLNLLHDFSISEANGVGGLLQGADGDLFGTAIFGGSGTSCVSGCGTIFKITLGGVLTVLHSFDLSDGAHPNGNLVQASDEDFYGTTEAGGAYQNYCQALFFGCGTFFRITPAGNLTTLQSFESTNGGQPQGNLVFGSDRNFYGTTAVGGSDDSCASGCGTVFKITLDGTLTTLHNFDSVYGASPYGGVTQASNGTLHGTTFSGGPDNWGTVWGLWADLRPFVETVPDSGNVGKQVILLGTDLSGATSVTFNGTAATFTVESPTAIKTSVPTGATTGPVQVVTPSGTLTSNVNFQVLP